MVLKNNNNNFIYIYIFFNQIMAIFINERYTVYKQSLCFQINKNKSMYKN